MNVRCPSCGLLFTVFFLAIIESGASQQLSIIKGVETESEANMKESLCQTEDQWLFSSAIVNTEIIALCAVETDQSFFLGATILVNITPSEDNNNAIIIVYLFCPLESPFQSFEY